MEAQRKLHGWVDAPVGEPVPFSTAHPRKGGPREQWGDSLPYKTGDTVWVSQAPGRRVRGLVADVRRVRQDDRLVPIYGLRLEQKGRWSKTITTASLDEIQDGYALEGA